MLTLKRFSIIATLLAVFIFGGVSVANANDTKDHITNGNAVTVRWTHLYSAPNPNSKTGISIPPNTSVTVTMIDRNWAQIESSFGNGFVPSNALDQSGQSDGGETGGGETGGGTVTMGNAVTVRWTHLYSAPDASSKTGISIPPNTPVTVTMIDRNWAQIESSFGDGYVPLNALDQSGQADGDMDDGDAGDGESGGDSGQSDLDQALADTVVNLYLEWNGQTRGPRVIQDIVNLAEMDALNPAKVAYDTDTFLYVQLISAASADAINEALVSEVPDCDAIVGAYTLIALSPEFFSVPDNARNLVNGYESAVTSLVDTAKDAMLTCLKGSTLSDLNRDVAKRGAEHAYQQFINIANATNAMR